VDVSRICGRPAPIQYRLHVSRRCYVAKYMWDGVLIYFGYPQAHEDDAERGVRAALTGKFVKDVSMCPKAVPGLFESVGFPAGSE
jgi:hypothetical protein